MKYNYFYNYVINHIRINTAKKTLKFDIIYSKRNLNLLIFFKKIGLIKTFYLIKLDNGIILRIYIFFYKNSPICRNLRLFSTPSKSFYISLKALQLLHNRTQNSLYILSSDRGLITHLDALKYKVGGIIVMLVSL